MVFIFKAILLKLPRFNMGGRRLDYYKFKLPVRMRREIYSEFLI